MNQPRVISVNVGRVRVVTYRGEMITTAIWKNPVAGRVPLRGVNFKGDDQADRNVHGGRDKAVYAYAQEDYDYWRDCEAVETMPGLFGENLTTTGMDLTNAVIGEQWAVGTAILEVAQPRLPCFKLGIRMNDPLFPKWFQRVGRMGAYLRIIQEGDVGAADSITVTHTPAHGVTLRDMTRSLHDPEAAAKLRVVDNLPPYWRRYINEQPD